nr:hypothetical protein CFP56_40233 [Quercus suber]
MENEMVAQNRAVQRVVGGSSKPVVQKVAGGALLDFPENIPREDTVYRDEESDLRAKENDQRVNIGAWAEADFERVLEKIDAAIEGEGVNTPDTSKAKS